MKTKPDLDVINSLFLELSQFSTAKTSKELMLEKTLKEIAYHTHCSYEVNGEGDYNRGVTDGHRCAATIARKALDEESTG